MEHRRNAHRFGLMAALTASAAFVFASPAFAQGFGGGPGHGRGHRGPGHFGPRMAQALELDEAQRQQMRELRSEMGEELEPVRQDLQEMRQQMRQLWAADAPDQQAILELGEQMDELRSVIRERAAEHRLAVNALLTPEQRERLAEIGPRGRRGERCDGELGRRGRFAGQGGGRFDGEQGRQGRRGRFAGQGGGRVDGERGRRGPGQGRRDGSRLVSRLNLDEAQQQQVRALRAQMSEDLTAVREEMQSLRQQMRQQWASGNPDAQTVLSLGSQMDELRSMVRERRVELRFDIMELLDDEQRARFAQMPTRGRGFGHHGLGHRGHGRRGFGMGQGQAF